MHERPWPRAQIQIRSGLLKDAVEGRGFSLRRASMKLGYKETYLKNCIYFGWISIKGIDRLETRIGIKPEEYIPPGEQSIVRRVRQARQQEKEAEEFTLPEHCGSCIYRGQDGGPIGCEYILITGHRRGCRAENCTRYRKGPRASVPKGLVLRRSEEGEAVWMDR